MIRFMPIKPKIEIEWRKCWKQNAAKKIVRRVSLWIWWWKWSPCFGPCRKCRKIAFYGLCNKQAHVITMRALKVTTVALVQKSLRNCSIRSNGLLKASMLVIIYFNCSLPMPPNAVLQCLPMQFSNAVFHLVSISQNPFLCGAGWPVCRQSFIALLGISASRLVRTRRTFKGVDARTFGALPKHDDGNQFTWHLTAKMRVIFHRSSISFWSHAYDGCYCDSALKSNTNFGSIVTL